MVAKIVYLTGVSAFAKECIEHFTTIGSLFNHYRHLTDNNNEFKVALVSSKSNGCTSKSLRFYLDADILVIPLADMRENSSRDAINEILNKVIGDSIVDYSIITVDEVSDTLDNFDPDVLGERRREYHKILGRYMRILNIQLEEYEPGVFWDRKHDFATVLQIMLQLLLHKC